MSKRIQFIKENMHLSDMELCRELGIENKDYLDAIREWNGIEKHNWRWTAEEDQHLRAKYRKIPYKDVYRFFEQNYGRSVEAVQKRAHKLGLSN